MWASGFCLLLLIALQGIAAFVPPAASPKTGSFAKSRRRTTFQHNIIFTRLAEDCMAALQNAQDEASLLGQDEVDNSFMLLGICNFPGRAASTLEKFDIRADNVLPVLDTFGAPTGGSVPKLSDFSEKKAKEALPYSRSLQKTLNGAGEIAEVMGSPAIHSEHVFLALLDYNESAGPYESHAATRGDDCEAMEIIWHLDAQLEGEDICHALLQAMMEEKSSDGTTKATRATSSSGVQETVGGFVAVTAGKMSDDSKHKSMLKECGVDLTQQARDGDLDIVSGRDDEIQSCLRILLRRRKNNVCLIGEAGVGKTSIAEGLAQILVSKNCPALLAGHRIMTLEVAALLAGTKYRGEFEGRLRAIIEEITDENAKPTIIFLDEIHTLVGAGGSDGGSMDAANLLKPYLARGQIQLIGATTITEYNKFIAKDAALERRLQPVLIKEPTVDQTIEILKAILPFYSAHHRVDFSPESVVAAAKLSDRFINERFLPDKAIDLIDEAGALATLSRLPNEPPPEVTEKLITRIISEWSNIPVGKLELDEMDRLKALEENLASRVKGQERAVRSVAKAIRRARTGVRNPQRPIASFLFCGVSGTGKTHLCKTLADTYYGSKRNLVRIDMSEYMEKFTVSRLTGPPPGFTGYEDGGQLTEAIRRAPHSVVLLDELEKAHGDVLNILLQVMEDGILTDGQGRTVSFKNAILIMTSNIGSKRILDLVNSCQGDEAEADDLELHHDSCRMDGRPAYPELVGVVKAELGKTMKPEFLNRIDDIVVFEHLSETELSQIATTMIIDITIRVKLERNVDIEVTGDLLRKIVTEGSQSALQYGARPMRRAVQRIYENAISDAVVQGFIEDGDSAMFDLTGDDDPETPWYVVVSRDRGNQTLTLEVEDSSRDAEAKHLPSIDSAEGPEKLPAPEPNDMEPALL